MDGIEADATRIATPCGDGAMIWRVWNVRADDPIVLLHGGSGSWRHWVRQIPSLSAGRQVIAPDLPGLGDSDMPAEPHDPDHAARIVLRGWADAVGDAPADLVGFSFGAIVAGLLARPLGARLRSLTLVGAGAVGVARNPVPLVKLRDKAGEERVAAHRANLLSLMIADPARVDEDALPIQEWNTVRARFRSRGYANRTILKDALAGTTVPLTVLYGEHDQVARGHIPDRIAALRDARPDAAAEVIAGAGHWVQYEAPEAFGAALDRALRRGDPFRRPATPMV